jgi:hypothetical protein
MVMLLIDAAHQDAGAQDGDLAQHARRIAFIAQGAGDVPACGLQLGRMRLGQMQVEDAAAAAGGVLE